MENPGHVHWQALRWVLIYLNKSLNDDLNYTRTTQEEDALEGYVDANYSGNLDDKKSLSNFVFVVFDTTTSWKAKQQFMVAISIT